VFGDFLVRAEHGVERLEDVAHARLRHRAFEIPNCFGAALAKPS
jgi:hypothetical protein